MDPRPSWLDRALGFLSPQRGLRRMRARVASEMLARHYEGAATGRRTQGWKRTSGDANAVAGPALSRLREAARDLVRNNGYAESALTTIGDHVVGWGIVAKPKPRNQKAADLWEKWAGTTACDSDGRNDMAGLQKLVMRTVVESGEVLVRRRFRRPEDALPIPLQIQVLDPDYIDTSKSGITLPNGGRIIHGVEFDVLGKRAAYWLFKEHPGAVMLAGSIASYRVPAEGVLHVYKHSRPGQVRGPSWFAPVLLRFKDFDEYEDATLMTAKIGACLSVLTSDVDGTAPPLGAVDPLEPLTDMLEPGTILNLPPGRSVTVVDPPTVRGYADFTRTSLEAIATGLGVTYEDLTGNYNQMPFSAARMSRLRHWARVEDWRWRTLIPQFCDPVWAWAMEAASVMGLESAPAAEWTAPPAPMIDPANEGLAYQRNIRTGIMTLSEALRERGYDPAAVLDEMAADNEKLDKLELILDSDARNTTQAGSPRYFQPPELTDVQVESTKVATKKAKAAPAAPPPGTAPPAAPAAAPGEKMPAEKPMMPMAKKPA
jgi:lambda family phage portal protein